MIEADPTAKYVFKRLYATSSRALHADRAMPAVYVPPKAGLPFLAVMISLDGTVSAVPFPTLIAAEAHNHYHAQELAKKHRGEPHADRT